MTETAGDTSSPETIARLWREGNCLLMSQSLMIAVKRVCIIHQAAYLHACRRQERSSHAGGRAAISDEPPTVGSIHHATVVNVRPFGLFVELAGFRRNGLVHNSQISEEISFSREDEDDAKVTAMEYFTPKGSQVTTSVKCRCM